jgi:hypothetical protein
MEATMINLVSSDGVVEIMSSLHHNHNKKEAAEAVNIRQQSNGVKLTKINSSH